MRSTWLRLLVSFLFFANVFAYAQQPPPNGGGNNNINPGNQVRWPMPSCSQGVYSPGTNTCIPTGTAANPAPPNLSVQYNGGAGNMAGDSAFTYNPTQKMGFGSFNGAVNPTSWGAKCDWKGTYSVAGGTTAALILSATGALSGTTFSDPTLHPWIVPNPGAGIPGDVGKKITIQQVGAQGVQFAYTTTIQTVTDSSHVVLASAPPNPGGLSSNLSYSYGTDDSASFQAAFNFAAIGFNPQLTVSLPPGNCMASVPQWVGQHVHGSGRGTTSWITPPGLDGLATADPANIPGYFEVTDVNFYVDSSIDQSGPSGPFPFRVSGTAGGLVPYGLVAVSETDHTPLAVGGVVPTTFAGTGVTSPGTVTASGGNCLTNSTWTANQSGSTITGITLVSQAVGCDYSEYINFSGNGATFQPQASVWINYPALKPNSANLAPPWYAGNCGMVLQRSDAIAPGGFAGQHGYLARLNFSIVNGPNRSSHTCGMFDSEGSYNTWYENMQFLELKYGLLKAPWYFNINKSIYAIDTNHYTNLNFNGNGIPYVTYNEDGDHFDNVSVYADFVDNTLGFILALPSLQRQTGGGSVFTADFNECLSSNTGVFGALFGNGYKESGGAFNSCTASGMYFIMYGGNMESNNTSWLTGPAPTQWFHFYGPNNRINGASISIPIGFNQQNNAYIDMPNSRAHNNTVMMAGSFSATQAIARFYYNREHPVFHNQDGGFALSHGSAPFASSTDLMTGCWEVTTIATYCIEDPAMTEPTGVYAMQPMNSPSGGSIANIGLVYNFPFYVGTGGRVPAQKINAHFGIRFADVNRNSAPGQTPWQTAAGSNTIGTVFFRETFTAPGVSETPASDEATAIGGASRNIQFNAPPACPTGGNWSLYASTTAGTELLIQTAACGTNITLTGTPAGTTPVPQMAGTQTWSVISQPDNINRGSAVCPIAGYWNDQADCVVPADLTNVAPGQRLVFTSSAPTVTSGSPAYTELSYVAIEPVANQGSIVPSITGVLQATPITHDGAYFAQNTNITSVADATAPYSGFSFASNSGGAWNFNTYNGSTLTIGSSVGQLNSIPNMKALVEVNTKTVTSNSAQTISVRCGATAIGTVFNAPITTSYNSIWIAADFTNAACTPGAAVSVITNNVTVGQVTNTSFINFHFSGSTVATYYGGDTGTANAYAVTLNPLPPISLNTSILAVISNASTGASTLALNGGTATAIRKRTATGLAAIGAGDIQAGMVYRFDYDGTFWETTVPPGTGGSSFVAKSAQLGTAGCNLATPSSFDSCTDTITFSPAFADPNWTPDCTGVNQVASSGNVALTTQVISWTASAVVVKTQTMTTGLGQHFSNIVCNGVHN
jgi:hypothetical protein